MKLKNESKQNGSLIETPKSDYQKRERTSLGEALEIARSVLVRANSIICSRYERLTSNGNRSTVRTACTALCDHPKALRSL